ncbi:MAG TPA: HEAT repeat domain-containing protein [Sulfuricurvum sp.]|nr:HEAT repeat domain-containing protein [Sulfuricurvum sp.]
MALVKKHTEQVIEELPLFGTLAEAIDYYHANNENFDLQRYAVEQMVKFDHGPEKLVELMVDDPHIHKDMASDIAALLSKLDPKHAPIEKVMDLLKVRNAYIRNFGITILQSYGDAIKYYIVKFLIGDDRDLRIFAINVLGDVNFAESRDMLVELLENEQDINVAMTAVDYMAEIGEVDDIPLLEEVKERFHEAYVDFAVDNAIRCIRG